MMEILKKKTKSCKNMHWNLGACTCVYILRLTHLPHQFSMHFGNAVDGSRPLNTEVRGWVTWRRGTKRSDGARDKEAQAIL